MLITLKSFFLSVVLLHASTLVAQEDADVQSETAEASYTGEVVPTAEQVVLVNRTFTDNGTVVPIPNTPAVTDLPAPTMIEASSTEQMPMTTEPPALTTIIPSPGASPVRVTAQSQVVESFIPEMTWCVGAPMGLVPTRTLTAPPYGNATTLYSVIVGGTGSCETVYVATSTTVCATTLTGLATKITVSRCDQEITFSTEYGFTLETPTPTVINALITPEPTVRQMMTYYLAPWQSLAMGDTPSDVDMKVCTEEDDGTLRCERYHEVWEVIVLTTTITTEHEVQIATTMPGPGTLMVDTLQAEFTDTLVYFNFSTVLHLATEIEIETTNRRLIDEPTSTTYLTQVVEYNTPDLATPMAITSGIR